MTNALSIYEQFDTLQRASLALFKSGYWTDAKSEAQAIVKVMAGAELGLPPFASMAGIHIVQGKPVLGANVIATLIKNDPRYDYRVKQRDTTACVLTWYENGRAVGEAGFTMKEAQEAGLTGKDNWRKYPSDMLFARAITRGARTFAPGIFGGSPIYTPDEMGVDTDAEGYITAGQGDVIEGEITEIAQAPAAGPLPDDEQVISEAPSVDFIKTAAAVLEIHPDAIKERLHALGYKAIPADQAKRLAAYRLLKTAVPDDSQQDNLFDDSPVPPANRSVPTGAYQE